MYKAFSTATRPMPLKVSSTVFANEWKRCCLDHNRSPIYLQDMISPFLDSWEQQLIEPGSEKNLNYLALIHLLAAYGDPEELVSSWVTYHQEYEYGIRCELEYLFYEQLRSFTYYPRTKPKKLEFVLAYDFRRRLKDAITRFSRHPLDIPENASTFTVLIHEDSHPDYLFLKNLELTAWEEYLLQLYRLGTSSAYEISATTHIPRETLYYEERGLWHRLRQTFSPPEP